MAEVYLVTCQRGEYEDWTKWVVAAYTSEGDAIKHRDKAQERSNEVDRFSDWQRKAKARNKWDPNVGPGGDMHEQADSCYYGVETVRLLSPGEKFVREVPPAL